MVLLSFIPFFGIFFSIFYSCILFFKNKDIIGFSIFMIFARIANPVIYPSAESAFSLIWWICLYFCLVSFFLNRFIYVKSIIFSKRIYFLFIFFIVLLFSSIFSLNSYISFFKSLNWIFLTFLLVVNGRYFVYSTDKIETYLWYFIGFSLATVYFPNVAFARDGLGFQGIFNHPQAMAVFLSILFVFVFSTLISKPRKITLFILIVTLIYFSRARIGLLTISSLLVYGLMIIRVDKKISYSRFLGLYIRNILNYFFILILGALIFTNVFGFDKISSFLFKVEENSSFREAFEDSRGFIVDQQVQNFSNSPILGIGFGVANSDTHSQKLKDVNGVPLGASTEKANLPLAILEETGIIGFIFFIPIFFICLKYSSFLLFLFIPFVVSNLAEVTFFSYGSFGLFFGIVLSYAFNFKIK